jgi:2-phosphosulfolactate phosphatase
MKITKYLAQANKLIAVLTVFLLISGFNTPSFAGDNIADNSDQNEYQTAQDEITKTSADSSKGVDVEPLSTNSWFSGWQPKVSAVVVGGALFSASLYKYWCKKGEDNHPVDDGGVDQNDGPHQNWKPQSVVIIKPPGLPDIQRGLSNAASILSQGGGGSNKYTMAILPNDRSGSNHAAQVEEHLLSDSRSSAAANQDEENTFVRDQVLDQRVAGAVTSIRNAQRSIRITVVIDTFRAFVTSAYILEKKPAIYVLTNRCSVVSRLASKLDKPIIIGKSEKGSTQFYDIPNSPTRASELNLNNRNVIHRTAAGGSGVLLSHNSDLILVAGFPNADATANYIRTFNNPEVEILPMGHEGAIPSLEDELCAAYIKSLLHNEKMEISSFIPTLKQGPGNYFFSEDQWQYPEEDFVRCLELGRFNFAIRAVVKNDHAILEAVSLSENPGSSGK